MNCWGDMMDCCCCCCDDDDDTNDELLLEVDVKEEGVEGAAAAIIELPDVAVAVALFVAATTVSSCCSLLSLPSSDDINDVISVEAALDDFGEC